MRKKLILASPQGAESRSEPGTASSWGNERLLLHLAAETSSAHGHRVTFLYLPYMVSTKIEILEYESTSR